jgi:hypothetical protein
LENYQSWKNLIYAGTKYPLLQDRYNHLSSADVLFISRLTASEKEAAEHIPLIESGKSGNTLIIDTDH